LRPAFLQEFVQTDRHSHCHHEIQQDKQTVIKQCVSRDDPGVCCLEQKFKVFEADPLTSENAVPYAEALKCEKQSRHRKVAEQNHYDQPRRRHNSQWKIFFKYIPETFFLFFHDSRVCS